MNSRDAKRLIFKHLHDALVKNGLEWQPTNLLSSEENIWYQAWTQVQKELRERASGTHWQKSNAGKKTKA